MKKAFLFLLAALMLLTAGCGAQVPAETTAPAVKSTAEATTEAATETATEAAESQIPAEILPETTEAVVLADHVPAVLLFKDRGDTLDIVGEYDEEHYVVKTEPGYGLVEKVLVRTEGQEPYESWKGYARYNTQMFADLYLSGEPLQVLAQNTEVQVLEDLDDCLLVELGEDTGFVQKEQISRWRINSSNSSPDGPGGDSEGQDGGDISMQWSGSLVLLSAIDQTGTVIGTAQVLADGTPIILGYFDRGDTVPLVMEPQRALTLEGYSLLNFDGIYAYVELPMLQQPGTADYEAWDGFVTTNGKCYGNYHLNGKPMTGVWTNLPVHVIADLGDCYLVEINETQGYMAKDQVSETRVPVSSGGFSEGSQEWSDPVL